MPGRLSRPPRTSARRGPCRSASRGPASASSSARRGSARCSCSTAGPGPGRSTARRTAPGRASPGRPASAASWASARASGSSTPCRRSSWPAAARRGRSGASDPSSVCGRSDGRVGGRGRAYTGLERRSDRARRCRNSAWPLGEDLREIGGRGRRARTRSRNALWYSRCWPSSSYSRHAGRDGLVAVDRVRRVAGVPCSRLVRVVQPVLNDRLATLDRRVPGVVCGIRRHRLNRSPIAARRTSARRRRSGRARTARWRDPSRASDTAGGGIVTGKLHLAGYACPADTLQTSRRSDR